MFNGVAMCLRSHVTTHGHVLDFELLSQNSMVWPCLWRCDVRVMGTPLDFEQQSQCSMVWPCVVEMWCSCYGYGVGF